MEREGRILTDVVDSGHDSLQFLAGLKVVAKLHPAFGGFNMESVGWIERTHS